MWNNIGQKIMKLSQILCWVGIIGSVFTGISFFINGNNSYYGSQSVVTGILVIILGPLISWISSWITYAIGEAADYAEHNRND